VTKDHDTALNSSSGQLSTSTARQIQLALKLLF
jgi:hypothetical protein